MIEETTSAFQQSYYFEYNPETRVFTSRVNLGYSPSDAIYSGGVYRWKLSAPSLTQAAEQLRSYVQHMPEGQTRSDLLVQLDMLTLGDQTCKFNDETDTIVFVYRDEKGATRSEKVGFPSKYLADLVFLNCGTSGDLLSIYKETVDNDWTQTASDESVYSPEHVRYPADDAICYAPTVSTTTLTGNGDLDGDNFNFYGAQRRHKKTPPKTH